MSRRGGVEAVEKRRARLLDIRSVQPLPTGIDEDGLLAATVDLAVLAGWMVNHQRPAMVHTAADGKPRWVTATTGHVGWPDLVLCHEVWGTLLFRELKSMRGKLSPEQEAWGRALAMAGANWGVWKPIDWMTTIVPTLTRGTA